MINLMLDIIIILGLALLGVNISIPFIDKILNKGKEPENIELKQSNDLNDLLRMDWRYKGVS